MQSTFKHLCVLHLTNLQLHTLQSHCTEWLLTHTTDQKLHVVQSYMPFTCSCTHFIQITHPLVLAYSPAVLRHAIMIHISMCRCTDKLRDIMVCFLSLLVTWKCRVYSTVLQLNPSTCLNYPFPIMRPSRRAQYWVVLQ